MTVRRRWPLHPAPVDGEALSSWLNRIAECHATDVENLVNDIGYQLGTDNLDRLDLAPPPGMIGALTKRTGVAPDRLRQMSVAGWVPWLLDDSDPVPGGFETYVFQFSVLHPAVKRETRLVPSWRPWLPEHLLPRGCPECVAASRSPQPYQLLWAIPIVSSCPAHGCWLEGTEVMRGFFGFWDSSRPVPRAAPQHILALDQRTHEAFTLGQVDLPRRQVHAGIWFRLLRTLIDELSCPLSESRPAVADTIRQIWKAAGYHTRDGQSRWRPYEQQTEKVRQHTMEAVAIAITLLEMGAITGRGEEATLFQPEPQISIGDGTPPRAASFCWGEDLTLMEAFNATIDDARRNPVAARDFFNLATYKKNDAESIHAAVNAFIEFKIPLDFHHTS